MTLFSKFKSLVAMKVEPHRKDREFIWTYRDYTFLEGVDKKQEFSQESIRFGKNSIAFLIPRFNAYAGGITSILRLGTYLAGFGHAVSYVIYENADLRQMRANAEKCLPYFKGQVVSADEMVDSYDFGIATYWTSVYFMAGCRVRFRRACYFIQDYEPGFYAEGDLYCLARKTYTYNLQLISLGPWNKARIEAALPGTRVCHVDFPYESSQYAGSARSIRIGKVLKLAVYIKFIPARSPVLILHSLSLLVSRLQQRGLEVDVNIFGVEKSRTLPIGRNLGKLSADQLANLYRECHIGVVSSMTNISLVPYEMIACGLPVVEMADGSAPDFFPPGTMIFAQSLPSDFCDKIEYYIDHQDELSGVATAARSFIEGRTWQRSAAQFNERLQEQCNDRL
jgi:glycosyltransferase involved in cell wall biosynthesis